MKLYQHQSFLSYIMFIQINCNTYWFSDTHPYICSWNDYFLFGNNNNRSL